ncbi:MAG: chromosomal replication initiator protein DnaA [Clostridia bacterium]|nr:chromosomal replication initiator protein DnaA [Oscillospiraceae bacterium]MBQ7960403.1 chromosomal replication initiator protein DnaA [Clostridia bacterium]
MEELKRIWERVQGDLADEISAVSFDTWIKPIEAVSIDDTKIILKVPFAVNKNMIMTKYFSLIESSLESVTSHKFDIDVVVDEKSREIENVDPITVENTLNPKYTFSSFVVGNNNDIAYVASLALAERPADAAKNSNPLFLYGGSGLGKTHLMQAIGNYFIENYPTKKVLYTTSEKFTYELVNAIQKKTNQDFRNKYRHVDLLLIDDVQFFAGKERAQEEFFHTFNALFEADKLIVLTSDRLPSEIPQLEERLVGRFNSGLLADVQPPDFETRMAILKNKIQSEYLTVDDEIVEFIADSIKSNVRDLEGAVKRILVYAGIKRTNEISMDLATEALRDILSVQPRRAITTKLVIDEVERYYSLSKGSLVSKKRSADIALPRQIAMYICREILDDPSFPKIGEAFGGRDHTTVLHNVRKISSDIDTDAEVAKAVREIISNIKKG